MTTRHISSGTSGIDTVARGDTWILDSGAVLNVADDNAFLARKSDDNNTLIVRGTMQTDAGFNTILVKAPHTNINIEAGGEVQSGRTAIYVKGHHTQVTNSGAIDADAFGARFYADNAHMVNHGTIVSNNTGVSFDGRLSSLKNDGSITGVVGVSVNTPHGAFEFNNSGTVEGTKYAFVGSTALETVTNSGTILGSVYLRSGADAFISNGGTVSGSVFGGNGNDRYDIDSASIGLVEIAEGGIDRVRSTVSYTLASFIENLHLTGTGTTDGTGNGLRNSLIGNVAANHLFGLGGNDRIAGLGGKDELNGGGGRDQLIGGNGADILAGGFGSDSIAGGNGADRIIGGRGRDHLTGGAGSDTFVFFDKHGVDTIDDFVARGKRHDILDLSGLTTINSFQELKQSHLTQDGADVVITDGNSKIVLVDHQTTQLTSHDFLF